MKNALTILIPAMLLFTACEKDSSSVDPVVPKSEITAKAATNIDDALMLKLVNEKRASGCKCGVVVMPPVPALTWNNALANSALGHSKDMAANNFLSHTSSNGMTVVNRYVLVGYNWVALAENIASGQPDEQTVMKGWIESQDHCKNIMDANMKEFGAARDGKYWTQNFGAR